MYRTAGIERVKSEIVLAIIANLDLDRDKWDDYRKETKEAVSNFVSEYEGNELIGVVLDSSSESCEPLRVARLLQILITFAGPKERAISEDFSRRFDSKDPRFMRFHRLMDFSSSRPVLSREDVIGRRLMAVYQRLDWEVGGIDHAHNFFVLDNEVVFTLPSGDCDGFLRAAIDDGAEPLKGPRVRSIRGQPIVDILCEPGDSLVDFASPWLVLANGFAVSDEVTAPHGTGAAGVFI